ncbi:MAG: hypothetical protein VX498_07745 [Myxococcota bacterium]|nr:hypothetical protein [Myxococcota bacterium]
MSSPELLLKPFQRLRPEELEKLTGFMEADELLVKGIDRSSNRPYRAGCLPYLGLVGAGIFGFVGESFLPKQVAIGLALTCAILATTAFIRAFSALKRSRALLSRPEGWHGLAWSKDQICFRSLELCLLAPWDSVMNIQHFDSDAGRFLRNTLWLEMEGKERISVVPLSEDGRYAGRMLSDWYEDLTSIWGDQTGRSPHSLESR